MGIKTVKLERLPLSFAPKNAAGVLLLSADIKSQYINNHTLSSFTGHGINIRMKIKIMEEL